MDGNLIAFRLATSRLQVATNPTHAEPADVASQLVREIRDQPQLQPQVFQL
jgi:hypothetical protein